MGWKIILMILLPLSVFAKTSVDSLTAELELMSESPVEGWKYNTNYPSDDGAVGKASDPEFDDTFWELLGFGQRLTVDSCWMRCEFVLPEKIMGQPVRGLVKLSVSVDDYGYMWINGASKGRFPWDGDFILTENGSPGMKFVVLIKAMNTGGPMRLLRANLELQKLRPLYDSMRGLSLSLKVGQKLLSFDTYQSNARVKYDPGIDKSRLDKKRKKELYALLQKCASRVDVATLKNGHSEKFNASIQNIRPDLKKIDAFVKQFTLVFSSNAHIDAAWLWRKNETKEVCKNTFSSVFNIMDRYPDFTYTQSAACYYDWMQTLYPAIFKKIQQRVKDGRWEIVGGMWIEPDCNLPDGPSWMRQLLYAQRYFLKNFGKIARIGWNPDSFGYNRNMPQFYLNAGIDAFITQKIGWNDTSVFPYRVFWWEGPDGSRILSYFPFDYVNEISDPYEMVDWLRQFEANTSFTKLLILFGVGDHGGGPSMAMLDRINRLRDLDIFPSIEFETATSYLEWLKTKDLSGLPVWDDELYLEYHRGTLTTQSNAKKMNRESEVLLTNAEKFSALAALYDHPYPAADMEAAWKKVLFNQFHDILPGSSIREVYVDAAEDYQKSAEIGQHTLTNALDIISSRINTSDIKKGKPVVVFNSLSQKRDGIVTVKLGKGDHGSYRIYGADGKEVPSQILTTGKYDRSLIFRAENVPPIGYTVYDMRAGENRKKAPDLAATGNSLENEYLKVTVDPQTGWLSSIWDKQKNREILSGAGNELQLFEDRPSAWDAWNIGLKQRYHSKFRRMELLETGPVRCVIRVYHDFLNPHTQKMYPTEDFPSSFFTQDIILYSQTPRFDFKTKVDWWEDHTMLKVAFPVAVEDSLAAYEIPYGSIRRQTRPVKDTEKGKWEVSGLRWADLSSDDYGVSLLNKGKYGYDIKDNVIRLSLLRSPIWPDPTADRGKHTIEYAIYPHSGDCAEGQTTLQGYEYNYPMLAVIGKGQGGKLPLTKSFVSLEPENLMLTTIKQAEDDPRVWIIQWYETRGEDSQGVLELPFKPKKVVNSNFLEEDLTPVVFTGNRITVITPKHKIETIKVYF